MGNTVRPELSGKNPYWIERHRFYELKHFCLQYPGWKRACEKLDGFSRYRASLETSAESRSCNRTTEEYAIEKAFYTERMELLHHTAALADPQLAGYILRGVTEGFSYDTLKAKWNIPCCRDVYYDRYRRFFWLLSRERQ